MSKLKLFSFAGLVVAIVTTLIILPACTEAAEPEVVIETVTETVVETVTETVVEEVEAEHPFAYENLRGYAIKMEAYPDAPGEGMKLAFSDIMGGIPFCHEVWSSVQRQWGLAGGDPNSLFYADNQYNATMGLQNADILLAKEPDVFINFQFDSKVNSIISNKYAKAGIPIIAVDVATPGAPFMGVNNFKVAYMAGEKAIELVEAQGGIDTIDNIILMQMPAGGEVCMLRSEGFYEAFVDKYGADVIDPITIRADGGAGEAEESNRNMSDVLASIPDAENCVVTSINEETMDGIISAIKTAGRWDADKWIVITQGVDAVGQAQIRSGDTDAGIAYFPETYGQYLVPAACALFYGEPVPACMYIENVVITADNIGEYYSE
jgi:ribose transport system substrate-binding protein